MKKLILYLFFAGSLLSASSQKVYFVYIQTESEQPFFVNLNGKIHSSSGSGYLILSKLIDSSYNIAIGFPQNKWPEQNFTIPINKKDHGFLLKQFGEKGWGLYNLQSLNIQMSSNAEPKKTNTFKTENKGVSEFTEMLSKVADDPSIKEKPVQPKVIEKKPEPIVTVVEKKEEPIVIVKDKVAPTTVKTENPNVEKSVTNNEKPKSEDVPEKPKAEVIVEKPIVEPLAEAKNEQQKPIEVVEKSIVKSEDPEVETKVTLINESENAHSPYESFTPSKVKKWSESSTTEGFGLVFIDNYENGTKDTIRLIIPNPKKITVPVSETVATKEEKKFIDIETVVSNSKEESKLAEVNTIVQEPVIQKQILSNNCTVVADDNDFLLLRKQMASKTSDEEMVTEAKAYFKIKCFTADQIKNLSTLFLNEEYKYRFFDVAYKYVSNADKYNELQSELKDEYYINRFKAMLRN